MSMEAASLEVLEKAKVPAPQARAIVQAIEIELTSAQNMLARKQDVNELRLETKLAMAGLETRIEGVRGEIHASTKSTLWHLYTAILAQMGVLLGAAFFFVSHLKP